MANKYNFLTISLKDAIPYCIREINYLKSIRGPKAKATHLKRLWGRRQEAKKEAFFEVLKFVYDPRITTNLASKSFENAVMFRETKDIQLGAFLHYLATASGTDQKAQYVYDLASLFPIGSDEQDLVYNIAIKNIKIGIKAVAINAAIEEDFMYSLVLYKGVKLKASDYKKLQDQTIIITKKIDGFREETIDGQFFAPSGLGEDIEHFPEIAKEMKMLNIDENVYCGEMLVIDDLPRIARYSKTSSVMRRTFEKHGPKTGIKYYIFDKLPREEFEAGISTYGALLRKTDLKAEMDKFDFEFLEYVEPLYIGKNLDMIDECYYEALRAGEEGIMIHLVDSKYETKKTNNGLWKKKVRNTADLEVVGFELGKPDGQHFNTLGNIIVDFKGNKVDVGGGFKILPNPKKYPIDLTRDYIWAHQSDFLGKIAQIEYDDVTTKGNTQSLRQPVFICWRDDKVEPSYD